MTEREKFNAEEKKISILSAYNYHCFRCGRPALFLAHRIAQTSSNIKRYGKDVIHHEKNMRPVCASSRCNDSVNIGGRPVEVEELVKEIQEAIKGGNE